VEVRDRLTEWADWGALGCWMGRQVTNYWEVPALVVPDASPTVDDLKHLGAALASYGSMPMFHLVGVTPEAPTLDAATGRRPPARRLVVNPGALDEVYASFRPEQAEIDLVVFTAPQLSLLEIQTIVERRDGRRVAPCTRLILTVNHQVRAEAERFGYVGQIERAGGLVLTGVCFYVMTPEIIREVNGYRTILTNSAKLANIIAGSGYNPILSAGSTCVSTRPSAAAWTRDHGHLDHRADGSPWRRWIRRRRGAGLHPGVQRPL
jgi:predicted aconitase